ncbi:MAG: hypothetical protein KTQ13_08660 [Ferruginibacter sp.]|nr:hypothetical protein [Chitinophagaceae bacterium]MBU9936708.1 hypothetical protein [Ferruginibacter sp.]
MNLDFQSHIPTDLNDNSRVWIYQSSRLFFISEALQMEHMLNEFVAGWKSHGAPVKGYANLFFGQFIVIMADESDTAVGGCSTDSSVHVIKAIEEKFQVQMFDRQSLAFVIKDKVQLLPLNQLDYAVRNGFVTPGTLYFNNTVLTKKELLDKWLIPVKDSWLAKRLDLAAKTG